MLGSLRARLIVSFSVVVALAVFLAGAGSLFLLRDQQQETALERYGHVVDPLGVRVTAMLDHGDSLATIKVYLGTAASDSGVRVLLLDRDLLVDEIEHGGGVMRLRERHDSARGADQGEMKQPNSRHN